jgi:hypothetical protein
MRQAGMYGENEKNDSVAIWPRDDCTIDCII